MAKKPPPIHPGEILLEDFLKPLGISQNKISLAIGMPAPSINAIVNRRRSITPETALRLGRYLKTGPEVWLNLQREYDLRIARRKLEKELKRIEPLLRS